MSAAEPDKSTTASKVSPETRQYAMAAVILEEWLHELSAIATEQSVLQKEQASEHFMSMEDLSTSPKSDS